MNDQMQPFSLLIKPASADCNLKCTYCFYIDKCKMYRSAKVHRMDETVLGRAISSYLRFNQKVYSFGWQGGEPTLIILDFFKQVVSLQNTYLKPGAQFTNRLQTNGTLLNDDWARFFSRNAFLVGVSLDGPEKIHDTYRTAIGKKGSYSSVIKGVGCLKRYKTEFNILTLISQANVHKPLDVYRFLRDEIDCLYHQYIECVEFDKTDNLTDFSITGQQWGDFFYTIFDEWVNNDTNRVSLRLFDSIIVTLLHKSPAMCIFGRDCRHYLVVEHNGDVYPCDFYVEEEMKLGNIIENDWSDLLSSPKYEMFGQRKGSYGHECDKCPFVDLCAVDCQKNRLTRTAIPHSKSVLCEVWKQFYEHSMPSFRKLENKKVRNNQIISSSRPIGHNDACPCGSGRKYKKCCMNN